MTWRRDDEGELARLEKLRAEQPQREREPTWAERKAESDAAWNAWAQGIITREIEAERRLLIDAISEAIAVERQKMRDHVVEQLGLLRAEMNMLRAAEKAVGVELPALPLRKRA
jgi:hypothetical protein